MLYVLKKKDLQKMKYDKIKRNGNLKGCLTWQIKHVVVEQLHGG
jgi:hypothetical protein